jgi:hypothetical protein
MTNKEVNLLSVVYWFGVQMAVDKMNIKLSHAKKNIRFYYVGFAVFIFWFTCFIF